MKNTLPQKKKDGVKMIDLGIQKSFLFYAINKFVLKDLMKDQEIQATKFKWSAKLSQASDCLEIEVSADMNYSGIFPFQAGTKIDKLISKIEKGDVEIVSKNS